MPSYRVFDSIFEAGDEWDQISSKPKTCASMLFFKYQNGSIGGGPFFVWSSEEGEGIHIARTIKIGANISPALKGRAVQFRNALANSRAFALRGEPGFRRRGHSEEFMLEDFPVCLGIVGGHQNVQQAYMSITWSPCIDQLDASASNNIGPVRGCFNKLNILAQSHPDISFEISFKQGFGVYTGRGEAAEQYLNGASAGNLSFYYSPETG
ncbi:hypothetical protein [Pseudomonas sp. GM80]|uniref:hypothetical protein n=1 Tax=Pseudomonas sp. GM80 TaxID=1144339 RepID=UPI00026F56DF|nr:hypothetical protein [Pseudomonas sp. GM80]EJN36339.1 hypothetical protein PMI37_00121 [Pseudomonas sp. GM80]